MESRFDLFVGKIGFKISRNRFDELLTAWDYLWKVPITGTPFL